MFFQAVRGNFLLFIAVKVVMLTTILAKTLIVVMGMGTSLPKRQSKLPAVILIQSNLDWTLFRIRNLCRMLR
uniref:Uncharacterized protein n=1 Tax=uncultured Flavobacteriia bacterium TaxID=212695 RepID=H6RFX2_9BACT|nr:hypothetical protein [uncultured bacterium]CCF99933.1 hypothetical protein VIS_S3CCB20032 [uncultured Flavobacteriia bacterium]